VKLISSADLIISIISLVAVDAGIAAGRVISYPSHEQFFFFLRRFSVIQSFTR